MEHSHRHLKHWDQWLAHDFLGTKLLEAEQKALVKMLKEHFGKHVLLIGVPHQLSLLTSVSFPSHTLLGPLIHAPHHCPYIEGDLYELPIHSGSIDLVMLPHTLEFVDNPRQVFAEACRIVKPEGLIVISGFNPYSLWGLKKLFDKNHDAPWKGNFIQASKIKSWLQLADFKMEHQVGALFSPPIQNPSIYNKFHFLEHIGNQWCATFSGTYLIAARAKVIPLTPIKTAWKQQFSGLRLPSTISGHIAGSSR